MLPDFGDKIIRRKLNILDQKGARLVDIRLSGQESLMIPHNRTPPVKRDVVVSHHFVCAHLLLSGELVINLEELCSQNIRVQQETSYTPESVSESLHAGRRDACRIGHHADKRMSKASRHIGYTALSLPAIVGITRPRRSP